MTQGGDRTFRTIWARARSIPGSGIRHQAKVLEVPCFTALLLDMDRGTAAPIEMALENQKFGKVATGWEKLYCLPLTNSSKPFKPIMTSEGELVGWHGTVNGRNLWTRGTPPTWQDALHFDERPVKAFYYRIDHPADGARHFDSLTLYECVFSIDGEVLTIMNVKAVDQSVESEGLGGISIVMDIYTGLVLGKAIGKALVRRVLARKAGSTGASTLTKAIGRKTASAPAGGSKEGMELVNQARSSGKPAVVNLGGTGEVEGAINLNPNKVAPRLGIPNLIAREGEEIGEVFLRDSIDEIVSNRLPPNTLDWQRVLTGAAQVLKNGGKIVIRFQGVGNDAKVILEQFQALGFREIKNFANAAFEAIK